MSDMTVSQFAEKLVKDKTFRKEVVKNCYDVDPPEGAEHGMGLWLNVGAERMGYEFDAVELENEIKTQMKNLSGFKKIAFAGSLITSANKNRKAAGWKKK